jgi:LysR family transcriptional regulator, glycine cleavage system transcriptional activator
MSRPLPPLNALRAFEAIARHLSFAKGAEELHVTPAALSHQIRGLEEQLGLTLFHRRARACSIPAYMLGSRACGTPWDGSIAHKSTGCS